ncbi:MAG: hypothetical protein A2293_17165 [Elusimicrobia bacterium RIFOXYB2_FULL_49_7]|nr:MAG: hypothetical protein A2293_17165 [Elusimicrobia bacterium RIFOXYB2_FULL_49_7]
MKPLLFLFDIDGTLLHTKGAGLCAFKQAAEEVVGYALRFRKSHFAGKVDYLIFKALFDNRPPSGKTLPDAWTDFKSRYLAYLTEVAKTPEDWIVYPGVREFLERIHGTHYCALLTGNLQQGAKIKLSAVDLWRYFSCGGFGDGGESREAVAEKALAEARQYYPNGFSGVWVVGDTVHDVRCGKHIGAKTLAVRTGFSAPGELESADADEVVECLTDFTV